MKDPVLNDAAKTKGARRRRSWYRRRLRRQRTLVVVVFAVVIAGAFWQNAVSLFSSSSSQGVSFASDSFWGRGNVRKNLASMVAQSAKPRKVLTRISGVYPYSVVPGGVKNADDLRVAALRDYVVRRHYAHFDFSNARLERATEAREVYLSYRIRDTVFWTRKTVRLHAGELLLTDGKITARARCGNQISDTAKPELSEEEPAEDVMDEPVAVAAAPSFPVRPMLAPPDLPTGVPTPPQVFAGGFYFPYVPITAGLIPAKVCHPDDQLVDGHCPPKRRKKPVVPEPPTMVLIGSGLVLIAWRYRKIAFSIAN